MKRREFIAGSLVLGSRLTVPGAVVLSACGVSGTDPKGSTFGAPTMGTTYHVTVVDKSVDQVKLASIRGGMEDILARVIAEMSTYEPDSALSRFNDARETIWRTVPAQFTTVVNEALEVSRWSQGAFDVTVGPLVDLWGFGPDGSRGAPPAAAELQRVVDAVGYQRLRVDLQASAIKKSQPTVRMDLSAIAKGFAADRMGAYLDEQGIRNYLIDIGGELRAGGRNDRNAPWRIAIERPEPGGRRIQRVVELSDRAIATSGDYRNFFEAGGRRFSHTIDPRSAQPIDHPLGSVTVVHPRTMTADAMATGLMVLGPEQGFELAQRSGIAAHFMARGQAGLIERSTPAMQAYLVEA